GGSSFPVVVGLLPLLLGGLLPLLASAPQPTAPVAAVIAPIVTAQQAPVADAGSTTTPPAVTHPVVLAQGPKSVVSAHRPVAAVASPNRPAHPGGSVLPFTGANLWLPLMAGALLLWTGVCIRMLRRRVLTPGAVAPEDDSHPSFPR
ncbi:MAG TPA: hypothetical protein VEP50_02805, partial [bacterium]|nr:hypothetical protein [bacterium]